MMTTNNTLMVSNRLIMMILIQMRNSLKDSVRDALIMLRKPGSRPKHSARKMSKPRSSTRLKR